MSRPRDGQRSALYRWERRLEAEFECVRERTGSFAETVDYVHQVWSRWMGNTRPPRIKDGRGTQYARGGSSMINLPRWSRTKATVLHEVAHAITERTFGWTQVAAHGREFARIYLELLADETEISKAKAIHMAVHQRPRRVHFARRDKIVASFPVRYDRRYREAKEALAAAKARFEAERERVQAARTSTR